MNAEDDLWSQIESLGPLKPLTRTQLARKRWVAGVRRDGGGPRCFVLPADVAQDLFWVFDQCEDHSSYTSVVCQALRRYARARRADRNGDVLSKAAEEFLATTAAANGGSRTAVVDFALRYVQQELAKGTLHLDPVYHNAVESAPGQSA